MDIIAHGLWTAAAYKRTNNLLEKRGEKTLSIPWAAFWGVFPDLFAFTLPWVFILFGIVTGSINPANIPGPSSQEPPTARAFPSYIFRLASTLYNFSHSLVIFGIIFALVYAGRRWIQSKSGALLHTQRGGPIPWEMGGWLLHILIDIPTHSYAFFPTPVFWPLSQWKFTHGIAWSTRWFMVTNYSLLCVVYIYLYAKHRRMHKQKNA